MSTLYWLGTAPAVSQIAIGAIASVDGTPANNTFTVTIGGFAISVVGITNAASTAAALVALLNASTEPYFAAVTWSVPSAGNIKGIAKVAGVPFTATISKTGGGTGTVTAFGSVGGDVASSGPNDWSTAANWSTGSVPVSTDTVFLQNSGINICWGLAQSGVSLAALNSDQTFTGRVGLDYTNFATTSDGQTVSNPVRLEYRGCYLAISATLHTHGDSTGQGNPGGSSRFLINYGSNAATLNVFNTATTSAEASRGAPVLRILANSSSTVINVRSAPGGVGIAVEVPNETSTVGTINISDTSNNSKVVSRSGLTVTTITSQSGNHVIVSNAGIATITVNGGTLRTEGTGTVTTLNVNGGIVNQNASGTITTINARGGTLSAYGSAAARTWTTLNCYRGATVNIDFAVVTVTNFVPESAADTNRRVAIAFS